MYVCVYVIANSIPMQPLLCSLQKKVLSQKIRITSNNEKALTYHLAGTIIVLCGYTGSGLNRVTWDNVGGSHLSSGPNKPFRCAQLGSD